MILENLIFGENWLNVENFGPVLNLAEVKFRKIVLKNVQYFSSYTQGYTVNVLKISWWSIF